MSNDETPDVQAMLDTWRERSADRLDPIRFQFIEALARRSAGHSGDARRLLDDKLRKLLEAYGADVEFAQSKANDAGDAANPGEPTHRPLAELLAYIASHAPADGAAVSSGAALPQPAYPELPVIDYFRETWAMLSTKRQLQQSQEDVLENAGPLNSSHLVHRSLVLMRELSPGYLRQFLSYVDALSWMEQMNDASAATSRDIPRAGSAKKSPRGKQR